MKSGGEMGRKMSKLDGLTITKDIAENEYTLVEVLKCPENGHRVIRTLHFLY